MNQTRQVKGRLEDGTATANRRFWIRWPGAIFDACIYMPVSSIYWVTAPIFLYVLELLSSLSSAAAVPLALLLMAWVFFGLTLLICIDVL